MLSPRWAWDIGTAQIGSQRGIGGSPSPARPGARQAPSRWLRSPALESGRVAKEVSLALCVNVGVWAGRRQVVRQDAAKGAAFPRGEDVDLRCVRQRRRSPAAAAMVPGPLGVVGEWQGARAGTSPGSRDGASPGFPVPMGRRR